MMKTDTMCMCWLDPAARVVSFHAEEGLEPQTFSSHEHMMEYVIEIVAQGYRIQ